MNKALILFSGTRSFEKVFTTKMNWESRGVDIDNYFKPFYNVDILKWDYKTALKNWIPDYIHASPVCRHFSRLKNDTNRKDGELDLGVSLVNKTLEIINYVLAINPNLMFTIENPVGKMRKLEVMQPYKRITTSYCKYGYPYQKNTDIWCNFNLHLRKKCGKHCMCDKAKQNDGLHPVIIGYLPKHKDKQMIDWKYFSILRKKYNIKGFSDTYFRYRIPCGLINDIFAHVDMNVC